MSLYLTSSLLGVLIACSIVYLVRRDHLHGRQAAWWIVLGLLALLLGFVPGLVDTIGKLFGVQYPPMLMAVFAIIAMLVKLLQNDIEMARKERRLRRLTQHMAMLEFELRNRPLQSAEGAEATDEDATADESARPLSRHG